MPRALPKLNASRLQVLVFGPGTGELILVRAPPGEWLAVDGCQVGSTKYALAALTHYAALDHVRAVVLTHPHMDHAGGVPELIDAVTPKTRTQWPRLGMLWPVPVTGRESREVAGYYRGAKVEATLATIRDRWRRRPGCQWDAPRGDRIAIGEAEVRVLSPTDAERTAAFTAWRAGRKYDANRVASALEVRWRGSRLILGADLVENPGRGWTSAIALDRNLGTHALLKVPHHGSIKALHDDMIAARPGGTPTFVVTPYASQSLPRFEPGEGAARLLQEAGEFHLTALPRDHDGQAGAPLRLRRSQLLRRGKDWDIDPPTPGFPDCWVMIDFAARGAPRIEHGDGSVVVTRG